MGAQLKYGTAGATGGGFSSQPGSLQPAFEESGWHWNPQWNWQRRSAKTWKDRNQWISLWPTSRFRAGGEVSGQGYAPVGQGLGDSGMFEPYSCDGDGTQSRNAIRGQTLDEADAPVADAIVQGFVTATDTFVGQVTSAADGTYVLPVEQLKTTPHYLVAYKAGSPDIAGTTVNTLLPTNIDGT